MRAQTAECLSLGDGLSRKTLGGRITLTVRVPQDLVHKPRPGNRAYGTHVKWAMGTTDPAQARHDRHAAISAIEAEFAKARGEIGRLDAESVWLALDAWRRDRIEGLAATENPASLMTDGLIDDAFSAANDLFQRRPDLSITHVGNQPPNLTSLLGRLERARDEREGWRIVRGFDNKLDKAAGIGGLTTTVPDHLRPYLRQRFAAAWIEVLTHVEIARRRAAVVLAVQNVKLLNPAAITAASTPAEYQPRLDDITLAQLIDLYRADVTKVRGAEIVGRKYQHLFAGLSEVLGADTWVRTINWKDVSDLRDLLQRLPPNPKKKFGPKITLKEAADRLEELNRLEEDESKLIKRAAPSTVSSYISRLSAMMDWAKTRGFADANPAAGMGIGAAPDTERRPFTACEREMIFRSLERYRESGSWRWWVPLIAMYTGARASEIIQLNREDIRDFEGTPYIAVTAFEKSGRRSNSKTEKTPASRRSIALHPDLVASGFLALVEAAAPGPLFPDVPRVKGTAPSHGLSKWFGKHLDGLGLSDPCLCFHSWRHGFKAAADAAEVHPEYRRALLGHVGKDSGERYGGPQAVPNQFREISKITWPRVQMPPNTRNDDAEA